MVDIFNEGVDIPNIDTVLFLRPTESLTIFLQQFGRGLRKAKGKEYLTVLDFVGHSRAEFNYMDRFRALMGRTSMGVKEEIEKDFPHLPFGCQIHLEEVAKRYILENISSYINGFRENKIVDLIRHFCEDYEVELTLQNFIHLTHVPIEKLYKRRTWNMLCYAAGVTDKLSTMNTELSRAVSRKWLSTDSFSYFSFIHDLAKGGFREKVSNMNYIDQQRLLMFYYDLYENAGAFDSLQTMLDTFAADKIFIEEMVEVSALMMKRCEALELPDNSSLSMFFPLKLHGIYTKGQIQVAIQSSTIDKKSSSREGCERSNINGKRIEAMFVDIIKDREVGSTTNYNDFAISNIEFHWETQNRVRQDSPTGQNYINQTQTMLLFIRKQAQAAEDKYRTMGYVYLGEVELKEYSGNKPMQIVWKLKTPMPASACEYARKYVN